jgi:hypothetical protein
MEQPETSDNTLQVEFLHSNLSLPYPLMMGGDTAAHERYMEATGADGMELTPTNIGRFMGRVMRRAEMVQKLSGVPMSSEGREHRMLQHGYDPRKDWSYEHAAMRRLVRAGHSSFRQESSDGIKAQLFPTVMQSLGRLASIQHNITGRMPLVVYEDVVDTTQPDGVIHYNDQNAPASVRTHQPTPHGWAKLGITEDTDVDTIDEVLRAHGIGGVTFGVFHAHRFRDPVALAAKLAKYGFIESIHLEVNRLDSAPRGSKLARLTKTAEWAFTRGVTQARYTPEGEMIQAIADEWCTSPLNVNLPRRVVLEEGPFGVRDAKSQTAMIATVREMIQG